MSSIRARRGNTVLELDGNSLTVRIGEETLGPYSIDLRRQQEVWHSLEGISVPLPLGAGSAGVGGTGYAVEIRMGMTHIDVGWWMSPPSGWVPLAMIFESLAELAPREIRARYDFGQGGE